MNDQAIAANSSIDERGLRAWLLRRFRALFDFKIIVTRFRNASAKSTKAVLRRQATAALVDAIRRQAPKDQVRTVVESVAESLQQLQRESVYRACADLTDLVRVHPRMVDPASFGLRAGDSRPVIVGPWLMEVGFELLYWIPYLRAQLTKFNIPKERVIAISRGGAEPWYQDIAGTYLDLLDYMTPEQFRTWTNGDGETSHVLEGNRKPFGAGHFETDVLDRVIPPGKLAGYQILMPSAMYGLLRNVWRSRFGAHKLDQHLKPALIAPPPTIALPFDGQYTAVKFYHSLTFPSATENKALARQLIERLARGTNVVLLSNQGQLDDHVTLDFGTDERHRIFDASNLYSIRNNLAVQTALVAGAQSLHCTYGGFSYLGPLLGVDTCAYTQSWAFNVTHLDLAWRSLAAIGGGQLAITTLSHKMNCLMGDLPRAT
jgi:hypothetical protein